MLDNVSTPKPAIAVIPDASTAEPVNRYVRASASAGRTARPRRSWRKRSDSSTLNSVEIAITSAPSVADIGLSGIRVANRISDDQPVASAIGTSGTSARCDRAQNREQHQPDREQSGQQHQQSCAPRTTATRPPGPRAPAVRRAAAVTPGGGCRCARM